MTKPYIKIRFEDGKIPNELNRLYKERGYDSREEMLRDICEDVVYPDVLRARDMEYKEMIHKYQNLCELVATNLAIKYTSMYLVLVFIFMPCLLYIALAVGSWYLFKKLKSVNWIEKFCRLKTLF